jgi:hypothetical protein
MDRSVVGVATGLAAALVMLYSFLIAQAVLAGVALALSLVVSAYVLHLAGRLVRATERIAENVERVAENTVD